MHPVIDGHNDLPIAFYELCEYDLDAYDLSGSVPQLHTDLPRLRQGNVGAQFWSLWVPQDEHAVRRTFEQLDFVRRFVERFPDALQLATTADEVEAAMKAGRVASLMGMEGGHSIGESLGVLRVMRALGVRYMTLTHNNNVSWADSATDEPVLGGLNDFGEAVVREMNRIGMLVDLSHVSADTMRHALRVSTSPVIFSHSSARAVCDVPRNVPDDVLTTLAANDGVCMVTFVPYFVSQACADWAAGALEVAKANGLDPHSPADQAKVAELYGTPEPVASLADVVAHVEHVREVAGIDHIGIGGDYDGVPALPAELPDVSSYPVLFEALAGRGWSGQDLAKLANGNILRVLRAADDVAAAV
ncbi:membrane dipeptidase [Kribbella sandramycini]|uniref:Membrane dipeptidase n=1 Tax=Kribbella sandramycini TaxID=60450 RepID=A0A7Y4KUA2_9ACTN|nr:dipeptidase [Kribbella sandramycini]MBB6568752.1 membrane dipeptidase [Kribbella sandramycini]NOL38665.1 membrane dipeptidase [Kribbella sandramycini]